MGLAKLLHYALVLLASAATLMVGVCKITPDFDADVHKEMVTGFEEFTRIWTENFFGKYEFPAPLDALAAWLQDATNFRLYAGYQCIAAASALLLGSLLGVGALRGLALLALVFHFAAATLTHYWLSEDLSPPMSFLALLGLIILTMPAGKATKAKAS
uniref:Transmembrane protein 107 n=1 Tax=Phaeomonas parva TaxID=124430 RepID=A0A7S1XRX8_9STRA|mmetsp:Transcript_31731/g.100815  ORF Transcript_31731/g.100815 Transcript_31731/m.100815 type:complete len:158 (+) Transcript_31731:210-683(+)|eukprot:CAMPEP_0118852910 /NCGR_PEP_ID=MMETSP1163-20130328/1682_1 /TAXON_ID=124430 /ORGANISM="Phaeomonas parva, Strain CCMP2877" /LENGTH=157 /DNA_ID=CAMNT_0006785381 /DNA_START=489 /DNA_END=962 /DNA_ORIENTATION=+